MDITEGHVCLYKLCPTIRHCLNSSLKQSQVMFSTIALKQFDSNKGLEDLHDHMPLTSQGRNIGSSVLL